MNATLGFIFLLAALGMGISIGAIIGFELCEGHPERCFEKNCVGDILIAPGDEDAGRYLFLDLDEEPEQLENEGFVVLHVRKIAAREKHPA